MNTKTIVIGNGIAGFTVASALAKSGKNIIQYSEEPYTFYSRVKLSQALCDEAALAGLPSRESPPYLRHGKVVSVDTKKKIISLADGTVDSYDKLVLATGSRGRMLPVFDGIEGVSTLRTLTDAQALSRMMRNPVCVLGGGLLGLEAARAILAKGFAVTVVEGGPHILCRQLNERAAVILRERLREDGLGIEEAFSIEKAESRDGSITALVSKEGKRLPCRTLLISVGVNPETTLAKNAGIAVERGIVVDDHLRTSETDVYAIGDCAQYRGMVPGIMPVALGMGTTLIKILGGEDAIYVPPQLMTHLKDSSFDLVSIGAIEGDAVEREDGNRHEFYFTENGLLVGAILLDATDRLPLVKAGMGKPFSAS